MSLITQSTAASFNTVLDRIAQNLDAHVNASLSKAHGINAQIGNYYDSGGDLVGNIVLRFVIGEAPNATVVYVPVMVTALSGGRTGTGLVRTNTDESGALIDAGVPIRYASLATEFSALETSLAASTNELLLAHSRIVHGDGDPQAHAGVTLRPNVNTLDSLGHVVGRQVVQIAVNGILYELPADSSITGPPQQWRNFFFNTSTNWSHTVVEVHHDNDQVAFFYYMDGMGELPRTVTLQINSVWDGSGTWLDVPEAGSPEPSGYVPRVGDEPVHVAAYTVPYPTLTPYYTFTATCHTAANNTRQIATFRVKVTNSVGDAFSNNCLFIISDEDGGWFHGPSSSYITY